MLWDNARLAEAEKQGESKMIQWLEMHLMGLAKVEKWGVTKMIQCLEVTLYQSPESRTKKK